MWRPRTIVFGTLSRNTCTGQIETSRFRFAPGLLECVLLAVRELNYVAGRLQHTGLFWRAAHSAALRLERTVSFSFR